jgi:hypothetical protein
MWDFQEIVNVNDAKTRCGSTNSKQHGNAAADFVVLKYVTKTSRGSLDADKMDTLVNRHSNILPLLQWKEKLLLIW